MVAGLVYTVSRMKMEFLEALTLTIAGDIVISSKWSPPRWDCFKLNVDAAFSQVSRVASFGMVIRDSTGKMCLCVVSKEEKIDSPLHVEIKVVLFGLQVAHNCSYQSLTIESDSILDINEISNKQISYCEWDNIISDTDELILEYERCTFKHIRTANDFAHNIAKIYCGFFV